MPMVASFVAVGTNCVLNYILIFGKLGVPKEITGVRGAAIATVTARVVECVIVVVSMYRRKARFPYLKGTFKSMRIPKKVASLVATKSAPLICNELCWSVGMTLLGVCYSYYGGSVVAGYSISSTVWNLLRRWENGASTDAALCSPFIFVVLEKSQKVALMAVHLL